MKLAACVKTKTGEQRDRTQHRRDADQPSFDSAWNILGYKKQGGRWIKLRRSRPPSNRRGRSRRDVYLPED